MKYQTCSLKMCCILEIIFSSSFQPSSSILLWKLMVWIGWETTQLLSKGNMVYKLWKSNKEGIKKNAPGEARTHGLQIMRLTRCLLRYGGDTFSWADHCYRPGGENRSGVGQNHILSLEKDLSHASAGNRTRVNCLEGSYAHHYTTDAVFNKLIIL